MHIGQHGLTPSVITALDEALETHELIKVRIGQNAMVEKKAAADQMAVETASEVAQILGNTVLLYRRHPDSPKIFDSDSGKPIGN